jgi:hypothetical protein
VINGIPEMRIESILKFNQGLSNKIVPKQIIIVHYFNHQSRAPRKLTDDSLVEVNMRVGFVVLELGSVIECLISKLNDDVRIRLTTDIS